MPHHEDPHSEHSDTIRSRSPAYFYVKRFFGAFPSDQAVALELIDSDAGFREICEEYVACNEAIERLTHTKFDEDMRKEYGALRLQIEAELLRRILNQESKRGDY